MSLQRLFEPLRFHYVRMEGAAMGDWVDALAHALLVNVNDELEPSRFASHSRKPNISRNFQVVSTWMRGNGGFAG